MKRRDLLKHLRQHGCQFVREGGAHSIWENPITNHRVQCHAIERFPTTPQGEFVGSLRSLAPERQKPTSLMFVGKIRI
jgi:predicted RNA binding protein YcfA (HicA-like mRNA interferase family)